MSSPYVIVAISISSILALAAIITTSNNAMNSSLLAQETMQIQIQKNQENLEMTISNDILTIKNNGLGTVVVKEIRIYNDASSLISKKKFADPGLKLLSLEESTHHPLEFSSTNFEAKTVLGITDLGNAFTAVNLDNLLGNNGIGNGTSVLDGIGYTARIVSFQYNGRITEGQGILGEDHSLRPYVAVEPTNDFASVILDGDTKITTFIPQFLAEYYYDSATQNLQQTSNWGTTALGFSQSRIVGGSGSITQGTNGIIFSGTGTQIVLLNDLGGQNLVLEGNVPSGSTLILGTDLQYDYMSAQYHDTHGFKIYSGGLPAYSYTQGGCQAVSRLGYRCNAAFTYTQQFSLPLVISSTSDFNSYYADSYQFSITSGIQNPTTYSVNSISLPYGVTGSWHAFCCQYPTTPPLSAGYELAAYDKKIIANNKVNLLDSFQATYTFVPQKQYYLIAEPNGGAITIKGTAFDPPTTTFLKIINLPPNTPYQITKNSLVSTTGMASPTGEISLLSSQVFMGDLTSPGANLDLYPNSMKYRGPFSTVVFDEINNQILHLPDGADQVYVSPSYVKIPISSPTNLQDVDLDEVDLGYLKGNYTTGSNVHVPIIPGKTTIRLLANGTNISINISDVLGGDGVTVIPFATNTQSILSTTQQIVTIEADVGSEAFVVASSAGTLNAAVFATISGSSSYTYNGQLYIVPNPPPPPTPRDPLSAYIDVYKNGVFIKRENIYYNDSVYQFSAATSLNGLSLYQAITYTFPQTAISGNVDADVNVGDVIEFYLYVETESEADPVSLPAGTGIQSHVSTATATATIHSAEILVDHA